MVPARFQPGEASAHQGLPLVFIALFLLVVGVHVAPWGRRRGAQLASLGEVRASMQGVSAQTQALGRRAGTGSLLTIDQHVVAQDAGRVEGSLHC